MPVSAFGNYTTGAPVNSAAKNIWTIDHKTGTWSAQPDVATAMNYANNLHNGSQGQGGSGGGYNPWQIYTPTADGLGKQAMVAQDGYLHPGALPSTVQSGWGSSVRAGTGVPGGSFNASMQGGVGLSSLLPGMSLTDIVNRQLQDNAWSRQENLSNWNMLKDRINGLTGAWQQNQTANNTRGLVNNMLANPESINDHVQSLIQNRAANQISESANNQMNDIQGILAANGQLDAGSLAAARQSVGRDALAQQVGTGSDLEIQRALQRNKDISNAIGIGQQQAGQDQGVFQNQAELLARSLPQFKADDYSGLIGSLGHLALGVNSAGWGNQGGFNGNATNWSGGDAGFTGFSSLGKGGGANARGSTSAGFNWSSPTSVKYPGGGFDYYTPDGVDPLANGAWGSLGTQERQANLGFNPFQVAGHAANQGGGPGGGGGALTFNPNRFAGQGANAGWVGGGYDQNKRYY